MSFANNYTPTTSFATDETNTVAGRSTVKTTSIDAELANISTSINGLNANLKLLQRDDGKLKDSLVEPYALAEQTRALIASGGKPRGEWSQNTDYAVGDAVQKTNIAYLCVTAHNSGTVFTSGLWLAISGDGSSLVNAQAASDSASIAYAAQLASESASSIAVSSASSATNSANSASTSEANSANSATSAASSASVASNAAISALSSTGAYKNVVVNGDCQVVQEVPVSATSGIGKVFGGVDLFTAFNVGSTQGAFTQSQGSITYNGRNVKTVKQTINTSGSNFGTSFYWGGVFQYIEGLNCYHLVNQPMALSFIFNASFAGIFTANIRDGNLGKSFVKTFTYTTGGVPEKITILIPADSGLTIPNSVSTGLFLSIAPYNNAALATTSSNVWKAGNWLCASGVTNWPAWAANSFIEAGEIQLEQGSAASGEFERVPYSVQLQRVQYYLQFVSHLVTPSSLYSNVVRGTSMRNGITTVTATFGSGTGATFSTLNGIGYYQASNHSTVTAALVKFDVRL